VSRWTTRFDSPLLPLLGGAAGILLFVYAVRAVGTDDLADGIRRIGWGLVPVLALGGLRFVLRAQCWRLCMPAPARLPFAQAFAAFLAGDAAGNITPLGLAASEPAKVFLTRHRLATREAVSSLAVDNLIYLGSVITVVALGAVLMLLTVPSLAAWRGIGLVALAATAAAVLAVPRMLRGLWTPADGARPAWRERLAGLRQAVHRFSAANPAQLTRVYGIHMGFHALAMVENYLTLYWIWGIPPTVTQAIVFESLNRVLIVVFKFVPFRIGVDEAASSQLALLLGIPPVVAVAGAIVRKVRNLFWTGAGLAVVAVHRPRA
jgi:hypothetical protein